MEKSNNKETINLLDLSDDESDISDLFIIPKKKKVKRRHRPNGLLKTRQKSSHDSHLSRMRAASLWLAAVLIIIWLVTLSWLAVVLYGELKRMDVSVKSGSKSPLRDDVEKQRALDEQVTDLGCERDEDKLVLLEMDSVAVTVPLRPPTKKMKKRKELDALAPPHAVSRRSSGKRSSQELLSESSDERSEYWNVSTTNGRMVGRKSPGRSRADAASRNAACRGLARACSLFFGGILFFVTLVLIFLFVDVRQQLTTLRAELDQVIAGSEGVPDALQTCHTLDRNFKANITHINDEIRKLNTTLNSFSTQVSKFQQELQQLQVSLKSAPELTSVPATVKDLQNNIGQLDVELDELKRGFKTLKDSTQHSQEEQTNIFNKVESTLTSLQNVTLQSQKVPTNETLVQNKKLWDAIAELNKNLTHINQTLAMNIVWAQEDITKDHKTVMSLLDKATNASTLIQTLQQEYVRKKDQDVLQHMVESLSERVEKISSSKINQETPQNLQQMYNASQSSSADTSMSSSVDSKNNGANQPLFQTEPKNTENTTQSTAKTSDSSSASSSTTAN